MKIRNTYIVKVDVRFMKVHETYPDDAISLAGAPKVTYFIESVGRSAGLLKKITEKEFKQYIKNSI